MNIYTNPIDLRLLANPLLCIEAGFNEVKQLVHDEEGNGYYYNSYRIWAKYLCGNNTINAEFIYFNDDSEANSIKEGEDVYNVGRIFNSLIDPYYTYLMNTLNNNSGITVEVSQYTGTTTDFIIYYDEIVDPKEMNQYKYLECKCGSFRQLSL